MHGSDRKRWWAASDNHCATYRCSRGIISCSGCAGFISMLNVFSIVVQQFPDIRHHRTLIGIIERNQRRRAGVLHLLLLTGIPDTGDRLHLHRTLYFKTGISWQGGNAVVLLLQPFNPLFPRPRGDRSRRFQAFSSCARISSGAKFLMMCLLAQPKRSVAGWRSTVSVR